MCPSAAYMVLVAYGIAVGECIIRKLLPLVSSVASFVVACAGGVVSVIADCAVAAAVVIGAISGTGSGAGGGLLPGA